jgi:ribonuclease HII
MRFPRDDVIEIGIDESGRGSIISVVVAGAAVMPPISEIPEDEHALYMAITDSKKLTEAKRDKLAEFIKRRALAWGVGVVDAEEIDEMNILNATYKAMHAAADQVVSKLNERSCYVHALLVDGNRFKPYTIPGRGVVPSECIVKGDATVMCIAAASILAKTEHDRIIKALVASDTDTYGKYGLLKNMGYGTKHHIDAIRAHGLTPKHRRSFVIKSLQPV